MLFMSSQENVSLFHGSSDEEIPDIINVLLLKSSQDPLNMWNTLIYLPTVSDTFQSF
jgi:hypothetical protein